MKILLTTLNSKYIHSNLAIRYLKSYCRSEYPDITVREFTINDNMDLIVAEIYKEKADFIGFSCYIWNIGETLQIANTLKQVLPGCKIALGGPEVSFDALQILNQNLAVDFIIRGEGEETFKELLNALHRGGQLSDIKGLSYRANGQVYENEERPLIENLDDIPFAYDEGFDGLDNKIIYYETSRGCPFNCQYCLSSTITGVRFLSMERIRKDLEVFIRNRIPQVKLVDRTFNCHPKRAREIFKMILEMGGETNFHFEMAGDLIDEETLEILSKAPPGLFQFEIGVQSTNQSTLRAIDRRNDFDKLVRNVKAIRSFENIHLHLDLIAGLPNEDYRSFHRSFNDVFSLKPHRLQLGFLKLLKGSGLRLQADQYGYVYRTYPPYEVLKSHDISYEELLMLKGIEDLLEKYYNTHRFEYTLRYLISLWGDDAFAFFEDFAAYWEGKDLFQLSHNQLRMYEILLEYGESLRDVDKRILVELLRFDYCLYEKPVRYPKGMEPVRTASQNEAIHEFFKDRENRERYFPHMKEYTDKQIARMAHIEIFEYDVLAQPDEIKDTRRTTAILFDYQIPNKIFRRCRYHKIDLNCNT